MNIVDCLALVIAHVHKFNLRHLSGVNAVFVGNKAYIYNILAIVEKVCDYSQKGLRL